MRNRRAAFTLVELLIVMAVIAVLMAIPAPSFTTMIERARRRHCASRAYESGVAMDSYAADIREGRNVYFDHPDIVRDLTILLAETCCPRPASVRSAGPNRMSNDERR